MTTTEMIVELRRQGFKWNEIARMVGLSENAARMRVRNIAAAPSGQRPIPSGTGGDAPQASTPIPAAAVQGRTTTVLELPVRPFEVPLSPGVFVSPGPSAHNFTALLHGDAQSPFHDPKVMALVEALAKELQPNVLVNMGDGVDCAEISAFGKDPRRLETLQQAIDEARRVQYRVRNASPGSLSYWLCGNHESRLRRLLEDLQGGARQIPILRNVDRELSWPRLLDLDGMGTTWVSEEEQPKLDIVPKIVLTHGTLVRVAAGYTARGELEKYGKSGASGHTHRLAVYHKRDLNGTATWVETGCTCLLDGQPYGKGNTFNWQNAAVFIEWSADRRLMDVHPVMMRDGRALWQGRELRVGEEK